MRRLADLASWLGFCWLAYELMSRPKPVVIVVEKRELYDTAEARATRIHNRAEEFLRHG